MPIRINLLAEVQASEEARRRDPVKRAMWVCGILIALLLAWSGELYLKLRSAQQQVENEESRWKQNETEFRLITESQKQMMDAERKLDSLIAFSTNRFLWAPVLNGLQQAIVPVANEIQVEQFRAAQTYEVIPAVAASKDKKTPAKPGASVERITVNLRAKDFGNPQEANYNKFKAALNNEPFLKTLLPKSEGVHLVGALQGPQIDPTDPSRSFYQFALECRFLEIRRNE